MWLSRHANPRDRVASRGLIHYVEHILPPLLSVNPAQQAPATPHIDKPLPGILGFALFSTPFLSERNRVCHSSLRLNADDYRPGNRGLPARPLLLDACVLSACHGVQARFQEAHTPLAFLSRPDCVVGFSTALEKTP